MYDEEEGPVAERGWLTEGLSSLEEQMHSLMGVLRDTHSRLHGVTPENAEGSATKSARPSIQDTLSKIQQIADTAHACAREVSNAVR